MRNSKELGGKEGGDGGRDERRDTTPPKDLAPGSVPGNSGTNGNGSLRRYLVLLQDCLAIKFMSISQLQQKKAQKCHQQHQNAHSGDHYSHQYSSSSVRGKCQYHHNDSPRVSSESANKSLNRKQSVYEVIGGGSQSQSRCSSGLGDSEKGNSLKSSICRDGSCTHPHFQDLTPAFPNRENISMMTKVDHSMQALFLYKEFREINLHCFWNSAVTEAFTHLEYKGSLIPSTILVGSPIPKYLTILKTAWSRKMLRSPSGYLIDFLGEIEELIADPIAKSHFVPLSDSLCWAIHELTSSGEEAFVDDICLRLVSAYPGMALPTKELIYQTLEKLTRERKIYQTAQGYFVVTPDTHRYISSTEPWLMIQSNNQLNPASHFLSPPPLDEVIVGKDDEIVDDHDDNGDSRNDYPSRNAPSPDSDTYSLPYGTFKRYNSLRIKKNGGTSTGCLSRRTLSMRLPKSKLKPKGASSNPATASNVNGICGQSTKHGTDVTDSFETPDPVNEQLLSRRRKHKSFLSRLLSFRGVRKSSRKDKPGRSNKTQTIAIPRNDKAPKNILISANGNGDDDENVTSDSKDESKREPNLATTSTQTNISIENLNEDLVRLGLGSTGQHPTSKESTLEREQDADSGRCTDSHSDADAEITAALSRGRFTPTLYPEGRRGKDVNRNVYDKIENELGLKVDVGECDGSSPRSPSQSRNSISPSPSTFTYASAAAFCQRGHSGNNQHHQPPSRCHSSASSSGYSYRDFYNLYRRRHYPSYYHQQSSSSNPTPTSPITSIESNPDLTEFGGGNFIKSNIRYPPRSHERKQIFDEITGRSSFRAKKNPRNQYHVISAGGNPRNVSSCGAHHESIESIAERDSNDNNDIIQSATTTSALNRANCPTSSTTMFTQTFKNSTNLELELRLPLGDIINSAMGSGQPSNSVGGEGGKSQNSLPDPTRTTSTLNEVNTMVNDLFTIKSFVNSNPFNDGELSSTIEFKTRGDGNNGSSNVNTSNISTSIYNNGNKRSSHRNHNDDRRHHRQRYVIETVSSKPYTSDVHISELNRESEII